MAKKKKKKGNPLLILLFALVLMIAGYFATVKFLEYSEEKALEESAAEEEANTPYLNRIDEIVAVTYTNTAETLAFTYDQESGEWLNEELPDFPISYDTLSTAVYALENLAGNRKLENVTEEDLTEFGLDAPEYTVTAEGEDGTVFTMYVGSQNGTTGDYYVQVKGEDTAVYTISSNVVNYLSYDLYDLIEMESYPDIAEDTLLTLEFTSAEGTITMEHQEETETVEESTEAETIAVETEEAGIAWKVTGDAAAEDLVAIAEGVSFTSCVDYKVTEDTETDYGFDNPTGVLTVTYANSADETVTVTLTIGGYDEENESYYCLMDDSAMVNLVSAEVFSPVISQ